MVGVGDVEKNVEDGELPRKVDRCGKIADALSLGAVVWRQKCTRHFAVRTGVEVKPKMGFPTVLLWMIRKNFENICSS